MPLEAAATGSGGETVLCRRMRRLPRKERPSPHDESPRLRIRRRATGRCRRRLTDHGCQGNSGDSGGGEGTPTEPRPSSDRTMTELRQSPDRALTELRSSNDRVLTEP